MHPRVLARRPFLMHAAAVVGLVVIFAVMVATTPPEDGANIGAGLVGLVLLALGVPWSVPALAAPYRFDHWSNAAHYVLWFGPAILNVILHGVAVVIRSRSPRVKHDAPAAADGNGNTP